MIRFWRALTAVAVKESLHSLRDRLTLALLITVPVVQLLLFGFAIDLHPQHLPTAVVAYENDAAVNRAIGAIEKLDYFRISMRTRDPHEAERWLAQSRVQFVLELPPGFSGKLLSGEVVTVTLTADATDPIAAIPAVQAARAAQLSQIKIDTKLAFNPQGASRLFVIPGLLGVILTLTMVLLGALSMVREREQGTLETLASLAMPRAALLLGKALPYLLIGCLLFVLLLALCIYLLDLPWPVFSPALFGIAFLFIAANLILGMALSLIARNAMQAMQLGIFFYLPSMLLSGFMFPFHGMPHWAQMLGELLPLTHFLRVVRGILLKGLPDADAWMLAWPILLFCALALLAAFLLNRWRSAIT